MTLARAWVRPYALPLQPALMTRRGLCTHRTGALLAIEDAQGNCGMGDAAGWPGFGSQQPHAALQAELHSAARQLGQGTSPDTAAACAERAMAVGQSAEVRHAIELALLDLCAQVGDRSVADLLCPEGLLAPAQVPVHVLVANAAQAQHAVARGATALKLKLGCRALDDEVAHVAAVYAAVGPGVELRLDVNGAWDLLTARRAVKLLAAFAPAWLEQPVPPHDVAGLVQLRTMGAVPIAVDEAAHTHSSLLHILQRTAADIVVLKPMFCGGPQATLQAAAQARASGVRVMVTHALESAVGRAGATHVAAALAAWETAAAVAPLAAGLGHCVAAPLDVGTGIAIDARCATLPSRRGLGLHYRAPAVEAPAC